MSLMGYSLFLCFVISKPSSETHTCAKWMVNSTQESNCEVIKYNPHLSHLKRLACHLWDTDIFWWRHKPKTLVGELVFKGGGFHCQELGWNHSPLLLTPWLCSLQRVQDSRRTDLETRVRVFDRCHGTISLPNESSIYQTCVPQAINVLLLSTRVSIRGK